MAEAKKTRIAAARPVDSAALPAAPTSPHPLVQATAVRLKQRDGWDNEAGLRSAPSEVLNINVTRVCLDRALRLMDMLLKSLEAVGFSVRVDTARKETVLLRSNTEVTVQIFEKIDRTPHKPTRSEERQRQQYYDSFRTGKHLEYPTTPQFDFRPTHLLTIAAGAYPSRHWNDTSKTKLEDRFSRVLDEFVVLSETKRMAEEKAARKQAAYDAAVARYQAQVKRREDERSKLRKLFRDAARLRRATILRDYITAFEKEVRARGTYFQEQRNWIAWASAKADWIDPLNQVCDLILDAPLPKQPSYWSFND